jgi:hypothetical protein
LIQGAGALAVAEGFVAEAVPAGEELFGAGVVDVDGFEGVWALAARAAAAKMRAKTNRFMTGTLPGWIPKESVSSGRDQLGQHAPLTEGLLTLVGQHAGE